MTTIRGRSRHWFVFVLLLMLAAPATAWELPRFITGNAPGDLYPGADRIGAPVGEPPVAEAWRGDTLLGRLFLTSDYLGTIGYSGKPIHVLAGIDTDGRIAVARLVEHSEPIVLIGIPEVRISKVLDGYLGFDVVKHVRHAETVSRQVDIVSGATVTIMVIDDTLIRAAIKVARRFGLGGLEAENAAPTGPRAVFNEDYEAVPRDWIGLIADGSLRRLRISVDDVNRKFESSADPIAVARPEPGAPSDLFIDLFAGLASIEEIGTNALGIAEYENLKRVLKPGQHAFVIAADGRYSFKGSGYVRGGIFDRIQVIQGDASIRFHDFHHKRLRRIVAAGAPEFPDVDLFVVPEEIAFDPAATWQLELLVGRETGPTSKAFQTFTLDYLLPEKFVRYETPPVVTTATDAAEAPKLWRRIWHAKRWDIAVLVTALAVLTLVFFFQGWLTRRPVLTDRVRLAFLLFTVAWLGFYANAQLSVVNVMTVFNALVSGFAWDYFLMEPLIFLLWGGVAASLLFWGRGVFCGWLCPFGALQELLNRLARWLRVPQWRVPWGLHERLWTLKYIIFLGLFGLSLHSLALAEHYAEIEPFKTAIILKFAREWPFVTFAVATLAVGLFVERAYCRYLCPLGAALAIPGRLRMFEWLKRYHECGARCQLCANGCMVQAIHPEGPINPNECLYCLHCQVLYQDDRQCPVVVRRRERSERRETNLRRIAEQPVDAPRREGDVP